MRQNMPPRCVRGGIFRSDRSALLLLCLLGFESQNGVAAAQVDAALLVDVRHLDDDGITHSNNIFTRSTRLVSSLEMWTRPSLPGAISTKAPKFIRRVTLPL